MRSDKIIQDHEYACQAVLLKSRFTHRYGNLTITCRESSYLLQCFQALVHFQGISQCSGSLRSNFIVVETVQEKSIIINVSELSCDNDLLLIVGLLANQVFRNQSGNYKDHTGTSITTI